MASAVAEAPGSLGYGVADCGADLDVRPWRLTTHFGQINAIILALILADFMRPATRVPRGVLLGIAAGIKLTPLAFGLLLLMRKDWKGIATLGASFAATVGIGFLAIREESLTFWFHAVHDTSRVGWFSYFDNVSIMGTLTHAGMQHHLTATALSVVQVALTLLIVLVTAVLLVPLIRARALMAQLALTAFMMLQISPISWSHHNTWYPLMLAAVVMEIFPLMYQRVSSFVFTLAVILATAALVGMYISPFWIVLAFSPHFNADQILMVPEGSCSMAGTMPYQLMYLFILVTFLCTWRIVSWWSVQHTPRAPNWRRRSTPAKETARSRRRAPPAGAQASPGIKYPPHPSRMRGILLYPAC